MSSAEKLLVQMKNTKVGWGCYDLDTLYKGFGFKSREGGKHIVYIHPKYLQLRATVARQRSLPTGYIQHAIKLITQLKEMEG